MTSPSNVISINRQKIGNRTSQPASEQVSTSVMGAKEAQQIALRCCFKLNIRPAEHLFAALLNANPDQTNQATIAAWLIKRSEAGDYESEADAIDELAKSITRATLNSDY